MIGRQDQVTLCQGLNCNIAIWRCNQGSGGKARNVNNSGGVGRFRRVGRSDVRHRHIVGGAGNQGFGRDIPDQVPFDFHAKNIDRPAAGLCQAVRFLKVNGTRIVNDGSIQVGDIPGLGRIVAIFVVEPVTVERRAVIGVAVNQGAAGGILNVKDPAISFGIITCVERYRVLAGEIDRDDIRRVADI